ncbi:MAG: hypothetical protein CR982_10585 [Candidatus Cloacimonadota bacterium]|nr:MAG: hypothetical protein CR982_10585 [Candidatus Cloacimonadota bacterium]PIE77704.1 MAG: hypothetical protein CSA15_11590 [Candidatus Delongbacteria bacterium]
MSKKEIVLAKIDKNFDKMSELVLTQLYTLKEVITGAEIELLKTDYENIFNREKEIDKMEISLSNDIINALVLHHPVASNLRMLISVQRMVLNLERVGDLVLNIVEFIKHSKDNKSLLKKNFGSISNMLVISINMIKKSLKSYKESDKDYAIWTIKTDDVVDDLYKNNLRDIIKRSKLSDKMEKMFYQFLTINNIISNIERIGDNASNMAEAAIYYIEGKDMRHSNEELEEL